MKLLIIIPCYNEAISLPGLFSSLIKLNVPKNYKTEVVIVNDCSRDETKLIAQKHNIRVLDLPVNLGIGGAVQTGLKYARDNAFDFAVQMDGDGQHPPQELLKMLLCQQETNANVVIGSRFIEKQGFQSSFTRRLGISYFHLLNRIFTGTSIYDSTSGYRLFDKKAITLAAANYPDDYPEPESLIIFAKAGLTVKEQPVIMQYRQGGQSSIRNLAPLYYCIKVTLAMLFSFMRKPVLKWPEYSL